MAKAARVASQWPQREAPRLVSTFHTDNPSLPLREPPAAVVRARARKLWRPTLPICCARAIPPPPMSLIILKLAIALGGQHCLDSVRIVPCDGESRSEQRNNDPL